MKKGSEDIILLHIYTIYEHLMMYGYWDIRHDGQNFLSFWALFFPFTLLITWYVKILKKWKKMPGDIIILHKCTKNHDHKLYYSWDMACDGCNFYFAFWTIFCPFIPPNSPKIQNLKKNEKLPGDIIILHLCTKNYDHVMYDFWDMVHDGRAEGQVVDGQMEKVIYRGRCPT